MKSDGCWEALYVVEKRRGSSETEPRGFVRGGENSRILKTELKIITE